jgi:DNA-binding FrmR family transcriptional regulator
MAVKTAMATRYLTDEDKRSLQNRINRLKGHADAVARMISDGECVDVILTQVAALKGAASQLAMEIARQHLSNCAET